MSNRQLPQGVLKAIPETFIVQELVRSSSNSPRAVEHYKESIICGWEGHNHTIFGMSKIGWSNEDALREVGRQLQVSYWDISAHGRKDKYAVTSQHIGIRGNFFPNFRHPKISLVQLYGQDRPLTHSGHMGNRFNISIISEAEKIDLSAAMVVPNLYGRQRVGIEGQEQVGRFFLEGKPQEAIKLLFATNRKAKYKFLKAKRLAGGSLEGALSHPEFEETLQFEIQKWQSYLWNKLLLEKRAKFGNKLPDVLPMWNPSREVSQMYKNLWDPSWVEPYALNFIVKSDRRSLFEPTGFEARFDSPISWNFKFDLPRGSFATVLLSQLFDLVEEEHSYSE